MTIVKVCVGLAIHSCYATRHSFVLYGNIIHTLTTPTHSLHRLSPLTLRYVTARFAERDGTLSPAVGRYPIEAKRGAAWVKQPSPSPTAARDGELNIRRPLATGESRRSKLLGKWHASSAGRYAGVTGSKSRNPTPQETAAAAAVAAAVAAVQSLALANAELRNEEVCLSVLLCCGV